jgi:transglutaminase-like putative cysteine protease
MTGDEWWGYVTRMSGKPGSGISPQTSEEIFRFLAYDSKVRARRADAVDPTLVPFLEVSKELSGVARIVAGTTNVPAEVPELRLRVEGDRRLNLKSLFANDAGQQLTRWTQREPNRGELQLKPMELLEGPAPKIAAPAGAGPVAAAAAAAVGDESDPEERIELLLDWLDGSIERGFEAGDAPGEAALQKRRGDATEFTRLFCEMAESVGLPARARVGLVAQRTSFHFHSWAEVWLNGWVPVDPYLGQFPADLTHIRLVTESADGLSGWKAARYPGLERLRVAVIGDGAEAGRGGGE